MPKITVMKKLIIFLFILLNITISLAQEGYPIPTAKDVIFYIQHNRGKNTFTYQPHFTTKGVLDSDDPILEKRQLFDKNGEIESLTAIQRRYAYGIKSTKTADNTFDIRLVSYPDQKLTLKLNQYQQPYVETRVNGKYIVLKRLFIHQKEGTNGLNTKVDHITFFGIDKNGKPIQEKLIP